MIDLGHIQAANIKDPDSLESVKFGFVQGEGLLRDVLGAAVRLKKAAQDYGYASSSEEDKAFEKLAQARVEFYQVLKAIESVMIREKGEIE